jgi:hypothetical protein
MVETVPSRADVTGYRALREDREVFPAISGMLAIDALHTIGRRCLSKNETMGKRLQ